jgi:hypothetical protein
MKTLTSSVAFQDEAGNLLGSLILNLPSGVYSVVSGGGQVAGQSLIINLDATGKVPGAITIWASDELSPQTPYAVTLCAQANGVQAIGTTNWFIGGSSPIDLSQMVPTAAGVSYSGAVLTNPTSQQTINGQTLNMEGASVGFSAAASTTPDSFFSRIAAGVIGVGTAIGNALGGFVLGFIKQGAGNSLVIADANGISHFFISSAGPFANTFVTGNGSGVVFLGSAAKAAVSDTTGNVTTAGGVTLQTTAQTLPATVGNDTSGGLVLTTNAGKSVSIVNASGNVQLAAGATLLMPGATSGQLALAGPAVAGSNTLTFPAATGTVATINNAQTWSGNQTNMALVTPTIGTGVSQGSGLKHQRFGASCTTPAVAGTACISTYTWTNAFADANYTPVCQGEGNVGSTAAVFISSHSASQVQVAVVTFSSVAVSCSEGNCIAIHE